MPATTVTSSALRQSWENYHKALDDIRAQTEATPRYLNYPEDRAKAYHALMEVQAMAYNFVVAPRMTHPRIYKNLSWQTNIYTLGQNGPDWDYRNLFVDGKQTYRLSGRVRGSKLTLIQVFNGVFGDPGVKTVGNYNVADMHVEKDGAFEIILGGSKRADNWIPLDSSVDYQYVFFRFAMADWNDEPAEISIERISPVEPGHYRGDEFDEAAMAKRIRRAENFIRYVTGVYNIALHDAYIAGAKGTNMLSHRPGTTDGEVGSPSSDYALGTYDLADDEALMLTMPKAPDGVYWSFQLGDVWSRSLDFGERQSSLNMAQAKLDTDGALRIVVSLRDPGIANWLDTVGRHQGTIVFRNYVAKTASVPETQVVKFADLLRILPKGTAMVSATERDAALARRRAGIAKSFE
ncbi:MAG: DUF1214 domain-containing protein [Steroidobacteraceae bacterium]